MINLGHIAWQKYAFSGAKVARLENSRLLGIRHFLVPFAMETRDVDESEALDVKNFARARKFWMEEEHYEMP